VPRQGRVDGAERPTRAFIVTLAQSDAGLCGHSSTEDVLLRRAATWKIASRKCQLDLMADRTPANDHAAPNQLRLWFAVHGPYVLMCAPAPASRLPERSWHRRRVHDPASSC